MSESKEYPENFGRPPKFKTPEELEEMIDQYFEECPDKVKKYSSEGSAFEIECPTLTGLAIYLGFCSRQSMYDYEKREHFSYAIKRARVFVERVYENLLQAGQPTGAIFALKNMGWRDKQEVETSGQITNMNINVGSNKTKEDMEKMDEM